MNKTILASIIGAIATIAAAFIGLSTGKRTEQKNIQNEINEAMGDVVNIIGDDNEVTINDIKEFVEEYQNLKNQNGSLVAQNTKYFDELEETKHKMESDEEQSDSKVQELEKIIAEFPDIQFRDIGLSVDGNAIPINAKESAVIVHNKTYYSEDIIKSLIGSNERMEIQDNILCIGKIIKEQNALTNEWLFGKEYVDFGSKITDSYGVGHTNAIVFTNKAYVKYSLNNEYSYFKCVISMREGYREGTGNIIISADDVEIYKSPDISKSTKMFEVDIPINKCSILTIKYLDDQSVGCIVSDAIVYN